jgi:hypothetical protein
MDLPTPTAAPELPPPAAPDWVVPPELLPDLTDVVIEDGVPVESNYVARLHKVLTDPLAVPWPGLAAGRPYIIAANVGLFHTAGQPPLVPDVMLSLDAAHGDVRKKEHNSYFLWVVGKPPNVVIEFVSDRTGGELSHKFTTYLRLGVKFYVVFDRWNKLKGGILRAWVLHGEGYVPLDGPPFTLQGLDLQLGLWDGDFEGIASTYLRWYDRDGNLLPTGHERAERERQNAERERQSAEKERQNAEKERLRRERLEAQLRALGFDPEANGEPGPG